VALEASVTVQLSAVAVAATVVGAAVVGATVETATDAVPPHAAATSATMVRAATRVAVCTRASLPGAGARQAKYRIRTLVAEGYR